MTRTATATLSASWASASKRNPTLNRNCLDREVVGAATLHRYCGSGVLVSRQRERSDVLEPAQSYLLGAGFSRAAMKSRSFASLRMTTLLNFKGRTPDEWRVSASAIPGHQVSQSE